MKKGIFIILAVVLCFSAYVYISKGDDKPKSIVTEQPLKISKNSAAFNLATNNLLNAYFNLRDAFVNWRSNTIIQQLNDSLIGYTEGIPFSELKADTLLVNTAKNFASSILSEAKGIKTATIENQKRSFYNISENLYNLLRTVQFDEYTIYHLMCPMAFNGNEEAYWLSKDTIVINPYLGNNHPKYKSAMLHCGSIADSISYH